MTVRDALNMAMEEEMLRDESVFVMGEEVARYNGAYKARSAGSLYLFTCKLTHRRLQRTYWTNLARSGWWTLPSLRWVLLVSQLVPHSQAFDQCKLYTYLRVPCVYLQFSCEFMTFNFAMQAIDQIVNSAGKTYYMSGGNVPCPVVFRGPNGAAAGVGAQHSQDYAAWYGQIPGLKVVSPWSAEDCKGLLKV